jgi:hypothetical protein
MGELYISYITHVDADVAVRVCLKRVSAMFASQRAVRFLDYALLPFSIVVECFVVFC